MNFFYGELFSCFNGKMIDGNLCKIIGENEYGISLK